MIMERSTPIYTFKSLEGLRGYMAWWVVFAHANALSRLGDHLPGKLAHFMEMGDRAVPVFIMLSGFVITHLRISKRESYGIFIKRRILRIYPLYIFCLLLAIVATPALIGNHSSPWIDDGENWNTGYRLQQEHFWTHLLVHLTLLQGLIPDNILPFSSWTILGPAWSLSLEFQFYLLAPILVSRLCGSVASKILTTVLLLIGYAVFSSGKFGVWQFPSMLLLSIPLFLIGIYTRIYWDWISNKGVLKILVLGVCMAILAWRFKVEIAIWTFFVVSAAREKFGKQGPVIFIIIRHITSNRWVTALGRASYSTYLVHTPVLALVVYAGTTVLGSHTLAETQKLTLIAIVLLIPISFMLFRFLEKPFMGSGQTRRPLPVVHQGDQQ